MLEPGAVRPRSPSLSKLHQRREGKTVVCMSRKALPHQPGHVTCLPRITPADGECSAHRASAR
eukprot:2070819-Prymnesium_polylepis.1